MKNSNLYSGEYVCLDKANVDSIIVREPGSTIFSEKIRNIIISSEKKI